MSDEILTALCSRLSATLSGVADEEDLRRWVELVPENPISWFVSSKKSAQEQLDEIIQRLFEQDPADLRTFLRTLYVEYAARDEVRNELRGCLRLLRAAETLVRGRRSAGSAPTKARPFDAFRQLREPALPALVWLETLRERMGQVCMIATSDDVPLGTGFLVGPAHVLTAGHVVLTRATNDISGLRFRFDFHEQADGTYAPGIVVGCGDAGLVASSPPGEGEIKKTPDEPAPSPDQLDFAVIQIERALGIERGTIPLDGSPDTLKEDNGLTLLHAPNGETMRVTFDTDAFDGDPVRGPRIIYANTSSPGSSGGPVLHSSSLKLAALHTYGEKDDVDGMARGVPIWLIQAQVEAAVEASLLPEPGE
jgi:Trypsin-like peptidase domain